jgi:hypothetical protein
MPTVFTNCAECSYYEEILKLNYFLSASFGRKVFYQIYKLFSTKQFQFLSEQKLKTAYRSVMNLTAICFNTRQPATSHIETKEE